MGLMYWSKDSIQNQNTEQTNLLNGSLEPENKYQVHLQWWACLAAYNRDGRPSMQWYIYIYNNPLLHV